MDDSLKKTSEEKEAELNAQSKKRRLQYAMVNVSKKGKHPIGHRSGTSNTVDVSEIEEDDASDREACLNPIPGLNKGIKRSLERLEDDRLLTRKLIDSVQSLESRIVELTRRQQCTEQLLLQVLGRAPPPIAPTHQIQRSDVNKKQ